MASTTTPALAAGSAQSMQENAGPGVFDPAALEPRGRSWRHEFFWAYPQRFIGLLRFFFRVVPVPFTGMSLVLRYDDVREVLSADREFPVGWGERMKSLTNDENFVLGMPRDDKYIRSYRELAAAFPLEDIGEHVVEAAKAAATRIVAEVVAAKHHRFDATQELVLGVPAILCESYYGITILDKIRFARATLAASSYIFGPSDNVDRTELGQAASAELSAAIRASVKAAQQADQAGQPIAAKAMARLIQLQKDQKLSDDTLHAHFFGMILGFIPTNVLAGGNMLETLLLNPDFMERARAAALADDDELLWRCMREALRFRHINPGAWRICANGYTLPQRERSRTFFSFGDGRSTIRKGRKAVALIQSAMFDQRRIERPHVFDPQRRDEDYMVFGVGQHWCIGAYIAKAQLTQTFKPLLLRQGLRACDSKVRTKRYNDLFPLGLEVVFDK